MKLNQLRALIKEEVKRCLNEVNDPASLEHEVPLSFPEFRKWLAAVFEGAGAPSDFVERVAATREDESVTRALMKYWDEFRDAYSYDDAAEIMTDVVDAVVYEYNASNRGKKRIINNDMVYAVMTAMNPDE